MNIEDGIALLLIAYLLWQPETLDPFRNPPGRLILLCVVLYLARQNLLLGCAAAILLIRVNDVSPNPSFTVPPIDRMAIHSLMMPRNSADQPSVWLTTVPTATASTQFYSIF